MSEDDNDKIKIILVGNAAVGKTAIINRFHYNSFSDTIPSTFVVNYIDHVIKINNENIKIAVWDTAGQEKYKSLTKIFVKDSKIVIFVYDITTKTSFDEVDYWVKTVKDILGDAPVYGLVGNKKDLFQKEEIDEDMGRNKADEIGAIFRLTSAKTERGGINDYMIELVEEYLKKNGLKKDKPRGKTIVSATGYKNDSKGKENSKCC